MSQKPPQMKKDMLYKKAAALRANLKRRKKADKTEACKKDEEKDCKKS